MNSRFVSGILCLEIVFFSLGRAGDQIVCVRKELRLLYILRGEDDYSLYEALEELKNSLGDRAMLDINTTNLEGQQLTLEQLKAVCDTVPFMTPKRLVIVTGLLSRFEPGGRANATKRNARTSKNQNEYKPLADGIKQIPESTVLVLIDVAQPKAENPLLKELTGKAEIRNFPLLRGNSLRQWIKKCATRKGADISAEAIALLCELIGGDLRVMAGELDKLTLYTAGKVITEEDVKAVVSYAREFNVFNMVDAILESNSARAENSLQQLLQAGESEASLLLRLSRQVQRIFLVKEMKSRGIPDAEIKHKLNITHPFVWQKALEQSGRHSLQRLIAIYEKILETDLAIKTGKYGSELALNVLVAELCQRVR